MNVMREKESKGERGTREVLDIFRSASLPFACVIFVSLKKSFFREQFCLVEIFCKITIPTQSVNPDSVGLRHFEPTQSGCPDSVGNPELFEPTTNFRA